MKTRFILSLVFLTSIFFCSFANSQETQEKAKSAQAERMQILNAERADVLERLSQSSENTAEKERAQSDLNSIDREIALAIKNPIAAVSASKPKADQKNTADSEKNVKDEVPKVFERWDVFKNFSN